MPIELLPGQSYPLNVHLTPASLIGQIIIDEMFFGSRLEPSGSGSEVQLYIRIRNVGENTISGRLKIYDWQEWWNQPPGDDRRWRNWSFTLAPDEVYRSWCHWSFLNFDKTYVRAEIEAYDQIIAETSRIYIMPGKHWTGAGAKGECVHKEPGLVVFWFAMGGWSQYWDSYHRRPPTGSYDYLSRWYKFRSSDYNNETWPTVFLVIPDDDFIGGRTYKADVSPGGSPDVYFNFTA